MFVVSVSSFKMMMSRHQGQSWIISKQAKWNSIRNPFVRNGPEMVLKMSQNGPELHVKWTEIKLALEFKIMAEATNPQVFFQIKWWCIRKSAKLAKLKNSVFSNCPKNDLAEYQMDKLGSKAF